MLARKVFRNTIYNSSSILIANITGVIITIYVARALKPELFGIYSLALSIAFLLLTFTDLGINGTVVRYVAHAYGKKDYELVRGYIKDLSKLKFVLTSLISFMLFLLSDTLSFHVFHKPLLSAPLKVISAFVFFYSLLGFVNGIFNAFNDFKANLIRSLVYELSRLFFVVTFVSIGLAVVGALSGFVIASFFALIVLFVLLIKKYSFISGGAKPIDWRRVVRFTGYLTIGSITWVVFAYVDSVMIGMFLPAEYVGYYRSAYNIVGAITGLISIPVVMFPVFVQLEGEDLKNSFNKAFKYSAIVSFPIAFGLPIISEPLIKFVYGAEYLPAVSVMGILSLLILRSSLGFWRVIFSAKEKPEYPVYAMFFAMLLNVVLNYVMILRLGIIGAALATVISNVFSWIILGYFCWRMFNVSPKMSSIFKPVFSSLIMCYLLSNFSFNSLLESILAMAFGVVVYFVVLVALKGLTREDFEYFKAVLNI